MGEAVIAGACLVRVSVPQDGEEFQFANVAPGNTATLQARVIGGARILWRESGSGTKWAVVHLGDVPQAIVHFQLQADLELGNSAEAVILSWDGTQWVPSDTAITVHDWYATRGMWQAYNGYKGLALKNACTGEWRRELIWGEYEMPIGCCSLVPTIATQFVVFRPSSVLDLGIGMVLHRAVVRQGLDGGVQPWRTRLVGVEGFAAYAQYPGYRVESIPARAICRLGPAAAMAMTPR